MGVIRQMIRGVDYGKPQGKSWDFFLIAKHDIYKPTLFTRSACISCIYITFLELYASQLPQQPAALGLKKQKGEI